MKQFADSTPALSMFATKQSRENSSDVSSLGKILEYVFQNSALLWMIV